jgi:aspartate aminotransferase-like enzyme
MYVTERARERFDGDGAPFYEDLDWYLRKAGDHQTPFTSAVPLFRGLAVAVEEIREEGMPFRIERHHRQSNPEGATVKSNTLTAIELPDVVREDPDAFFGAVAERNVSISGGQAHLGGRIFRVSNMGNLTAEQVLRGVRTVGEAMNDAGFGCDPEAGVEAARSRLA